MNLKQIFQAELVSMLTDIPELVDTDGEDVAGIRESNTPTDERSNRKQKFEEKNESTKFTECVLKSEERVLYVYCVSQLEDHNSNGA